MSTYMKIPFSKSVITHEYNIFPENKINIDLTITHNKIFASINFTYCILSTDLQSE